MLNIKKLGPINEGEIQLNNLTIFIGESGSGKTYASYMIYAMFEHLHSIQNNYEYMTTTDIKELINNNSVMLDFSSFNSKILNYAEESFYENQKKILASTFNVKESFFKDVEVKFNYNDFPDIKLIVNKRILTLLINRACFKDSDKYYRCKAEIDNDKVIIKLLKTNPESINEQEMDIFDFKRLNHYFNNVIRNFTKFTSLIYIPAERVGLHVFKDELNKGRLEDYSDLSMSLNNSNNDVKLDIPTYPKPISSYLNNLNNWLFKNKQDRYLKGEIEISTVDLLNGKFEIDENDEIFFREKYEDSKFKPQKIPFQVSSSTLKSLLGFDLYIKEGLRKGDYLIIDEPELNLHFKSQKEIAGVLRELVKKGIHIILSTHSDYLVRELINLELEDYLETLSNKVKMISCMYFHDNTIENLDDIKSTSFIENFDSSYVDVESKYYDLLNEIEDSLHD